MTFLNKLMDKKSKSSVTSSPSKESSSSFPSLSSFLHKSSSSMDSKISSNSNSSTLPRTPVENTASAPMNVDSPGNKRGVPWQEQYRENKLPRRSADTITNDFAHQVSVSEAQATSKQSYSTLNSHNAIGKADMDYTQQASSQASQPHPLPVLPSIIESRQPQEEQRQQQQQQQQLQHTVTKPLHTGNMSTATINSSYVPVYNSQAMLQHRQNRPQLKLADFHLMRTLGTGSFGRVHLIQSRVNSRHYAMKVLKKSEVVRLKQVEHTNNEKHILESVTHPFLVTLWGTFQDDSNLYMVMDYVAGGELFTVLRRSNRFPDHVAKFYAGEVLLALEYLHSKDIIYRDLKPENLLLDNQGHIKITDFGFAKYVPDITWTLCGTPDYLAPEVIQSKGYGKAVDWWSLGVLIYEMLAGQPPFYDDDHLILYEKILAGKIRWPQHFEPAAVHLLRKLLTADLSKRYGNLKAGSDDIKRHAWFEGVDFNLMLARQIRAPYIPTIRGDGDASHFDKYPETNEQYGAVGLSDPYRHLFLSF